jgi:hypothetical protein
MHIHSMLATFGWALIGSMSPMYAVSAQSQLPAPNRTIYKCQVKGTISYSDEPCIGAQRLDAVPTRGVDRLSGSAVTGKDVRNEIHTEQFAHAIRPLTGMNAAQFSSAARRHGLDAAAQRECSQLEPTILKLEQAERHASAAMIGRIQQDLFVLRKQYQKLGC